jgi:Tat protein secretion system quality control protein TatD with DNase activity
MFHGFSGNSDVLKQLSKYEHSYFSIGPQLLKNKMIQELISKIPLNRLLFETDAGKFSIIEIYETASCILKIEMKNLQLLIKNNTLEFFGQKALLHF